MNQARSSGRNRGGTAAAGWSCCVPEKPNGRPRITLRIGTRNPRYGFAGSAITRRISAARAGVTRSSASIESTQSPEASAEREVALAGEVVKGADRDDVGLCSGDLQGRVAAGRVDDDDALVGPARRRQAVGEVVRLVLGHDQHRDAGLRHSAPPS